jgi:hypothetical protein
MMQDGRNDLDGRLYGIMQHLMTAAAQHAPLPIPGPRGIVRQQDALDALLVIAGFIDSRAQAGAVKEDTAVSTASMLMLIRDYIQPLPPGPADEGGADLVTSDLEQKVVQLRIAVANEDIHG